MADLKFSFGKRDFVWIGLIIVLVGVGFGYAYNENGVGGDPSVMGHSTDEIEGSSSGACSINVSSCYWTPRYSIPNTKPVTYSVYNCSSDEVMVGVEESNSGGTHTSSYMTVPYYYNKVVSVKCCKMSCS
jgi:hypothetical protein